MVALGSASGVGLDGRLRRGAAEARVEIGRVAHAGAASFASTASMVARASGSKTR
ncbi:hypothetical protein I552_7286 [Mycobacterium xenopi 3993]|nr:hypothetical protein I552_7286 [Mycobacterium xenopi 3993]